MRLIFLCLIGTCLVGCGATCPPMLYTTEIAKVYDLETGNPLCGVTVKLIDGDYIDEFELNYTGNCSNSNVTYSRPGNYRVIISKNGYETWDLQNVIITRSGCKVESQSVDVYLDQSE